MTDSSPLSIQCLTLANEQRTAYGLRYSDYRRYRHHCANRCHRLRSSLKMTHGKGRDFKTLPAITLANVQNGHLELLLLEAERCWAYSQELSIEASKTESGKTRKAATGKLRRAVNWTTRLLSLSQELYSKSRLSALDLVQAYAYTLILTGRLLKHKDEFEDALIQLSVARNLLDELANRAANSQDQVLATHFADEISTEIRFCAYQLGSPNAANVDEIVKNTSSQHRAELVTGFAGLIEKIKDNSASTSKKMLAPITWEGEPVPIRNPELVDTLLTVQEAEAKLSSKIGKSQDVKHKRGVAAFDAVLSALSEAEDVARKLLEAQQASSAGNEVRAGKRDLQFVHSFVTYQLLSRRVQRDLSLIAALLNETSSNAHAAQVDARLYPAIVKLYETTLQSLDHMQFLNVVEESQTLSEAIIARIAYSKAQKCLFLSRSYKTVKHYAEALTLIQRATLYAREAKSTNSNEDIPELAFYPLPRDLLQKLDKEIQDDGLNAKKAWFNYNGGTIDGDPETFKKPPFYDIALNYVQLDMDRLQTRAGLTPVANKPITSSPELKQIARVKAGEVERSSTPEPTQPASGGLGSLLGGWWGRK